jgi:2,3-diaminopropionate biosynthesis protein SbnA
MTVISAPAEFPPQDVFVRLGPEFGGRLFLKCEGLNFASSVKLKSALQMVNEGEREGRIRPGVTLVESSSGNMGVALSVVAASKGYRFVCVTDVRCAAASRDIMTALGAEVHVIAEPLAVGGFRAARLQRVQELVARDGHVWLNQYTNPANWRAHTLHTAPGIAAQFPDLDVLFVDAGTTGTLMGCARYFRQRRHKARVVAVHVRGSENFGGPAGARMTPGLDTSGRPENLDMSFVDDVVPVSEVDAIRTCRRLARTGLLLGGSTGSVVAGATQWCKQHGGQDLTAVAISPDMGERYLDTIYNDEWVKEHFGAEVLAELSWSTRARGQPTITTNVGRSGC